ncbi:MAG: PQQ-binding-like beta-propeller repeat protein, partial [Actinomycetota bacterium]
AALEIAAKQSPDWAPRWTAVIRPPTEGGGAPGLPDVTLTQPLCATGCLFLPSAVGNDAQGITALNEETGAIRWTAATGAPTGLAADNQGRLFVGTARGVLIALDCRDGRTLFERKIDPKAQPPISVAAAGDVVIAWGADAVQAFRTSSGEALWSFPFKPITERPAVLGNLVFLATPEGVLSAIELSTGRVAWRRDESRPGINFPIVTEQPVLDGDHLVFTPTDAVLALDPRSGRLQLSLARDLATNRHEKVLAAEELAVTAPERVSPIYVRYRRGALTVRRLPGKSTADGIVYGLDEDSNFAAFDVDTGARLQRFDGSVDGGREVVIGRHVYAFDAKGKLLAFPRTPRPAAP